MLTPKSNNAQAIPTVVETTKTETKTKLPVNSVLTLFLLQNGVEMCISE